MKTFFLLLWGVLVLCHLWFLYQFVTTERILDGLWVIITALAIRETKEEYKGYD